MKVKIYEGGADVCDQMTIDVMAENDQIDCIFEGKTHEEALDWLAQALNDEFLDTVNNFHTIVTIK